MGTDIHGVLETRYDRETRWFPECTMEDDRNYAVFAMLANVRNGRGFAGIETHVPIQPISEPRGWPRDFNLYECMSWLNPGAGYRKPREANLPVCPENLYREELWLEGDGEIPWLGDHSFSWLSIKELKEWTGWSQTLFETGYISRHQYERWDRVSPPDGWCGMISGPDIVLAQDGVPPPADWTHVRVSWDRPLSHSVAVFKAWVDYAALKTEGREARIVFGFDS